MHSPEQVDEIPNRENLPCVGMAGHLKVHSFRSVFLHTHRPVIRHDEEPVPVNPPQQIPGGKPPAGFPGILTSCQGSVTANDARPVPQNRNSVSLNCLL